MRHLAANGPGGESYRTRALADQWELYDLDADPVEAVNRWHDPAAGPVLDHLRRVLADERVPRVPARNTPWPYTHRHPTGGPVSKKPPLPARWLRRAVQKVGMHPEDTASRSTATSTAAAPWWCAPTTPRSTSARPPGCTRRR